ncbi:MAG: trypsin-like peptidase domain-containing protein, partial [Bdellovibrionales bacterium]|nr:trypsin-like peptidase domain-containing protein [Oligoflexia bacterium]
APRGPKAQPVALGTGFVIDAAEGLILTNNHVIQGAEEVKVQFKEEETELIPAQVVGRDPELDVALLKVKIKTKLVAIPLGDSDAIDVGEYVLAVGNPLGYGHSVSHGILSAKGRRNPEFRVGRYLQTDASINPGNSGGPLINVRGEVIGINNAIDARAQGIGFAIPINLVKGVLAQLKTKGTVARGYLGVSAADLNPDIAAQLHMDPKLQGVVVSDVSAGAPAEMAGIRPYDVITSVNGEKITNSQDLTMKITSIPVGQNAKVEILRGSKPQILEVKVAERPVDGITSAGRNRGRRSGQGPGANADLSTFGFRVVEVTPENAQSYGFPPGLIEQKALVVSSVEPGSAASNGGLNQGDIIMDVSGKAVRSTTELEKAFKSLKSSAMVRVKRFDSAGNDYVAVVVLNN